MNYDFGDLPEMTIRSMFETTHELIKQAQKDQGLPAQGLHTGAHHGIPGPYAQIVYTLVQEITPILEASKQLPVTKANHVNLIHNTDVMLSWLDSINVEIWLREAHKSAEQEPDLSEFAVADVHTITDEVGIDFEIKSNPNEIVLDILFAAKALATAAIEAVQTLASEQLAAYRSTPAYVADRSMDAPVVSPATMKFNECYGLLTLVYDEITPFTAQQKAVQALSTLVAGVKDPYVKKIVAELSDSLKTGFSLKRAGRKIAGAMSNTKSHKTFKRETLNNLDLVLRVFERAIDPQGYLASSPDLDFDNKSINAIYGKLDTKNTHAVDPTPEAEKGATPARKTSIESIGAASIAFEGEEKTLGHVRPGFAANVTGAKPKPTEKAKAAEAALQKPKAFPAAHLQRQPSGRRSFAARPIRRVDDDAAPPPAPTTPRRAE